MKQIILKASLVFMLVLGINSLAKAQCSPQFCFKNNLPCSLTLSWYSPCQAEPFPTFTLQDGCIFPPVVSSDNCSACATGIIVGSTVILFSSSGDTIYDIPGYGCCPNGIRVTMRGSTGTFEFDCI